MSTDQNLQQTVDRFLAHKRALGRKYQSEEKELRLLVAFATEHDAARLSELTPALLEQFLGSRARSQPRSFNHLRNAVGRLMDWAVTHELIAVSPLRTRCRRVTSHRIPFLFDPAQARRLLDAAGALPDNPRAARRRTTYRTMLALCYGLGLRAGEVCGLRLGDLDTTRTLLVVRGGKFGKTRLVPHGPRIAALLAAQLQRRREDDATGSEDPLFTFVNSRPVDPCTASQVFHRVVMTLDLPVPDGVSPPTLHSLRHSFAVGCLLRWYRQGLDPASRLHQLSTFMGHVDPSSTAIYLTITPELLDEAKPQVRTVRRAGLDGDRTMTSQTPLGQLLHSFLQDHLIVVKGLRPATVRSYRDTIRLLIVFIAAEKRSKITKLTVGDLTFERVVAFLRHLEHDRGNHTRTRNQRLVVIHTLFEYIATRSPEMLAVCQRVAAIPTKRVPPPETRFLELDEIQRLLHSLPDRGRHALRDRALILFLYNTGARVQEQNAVGDVAEAIDCGGGRRDSSLGIAWRSSTASWSEAGVNPLARCRRGRSLARRDRLLEDWWVAGVSVELLPDGPAAGVLAAIEAADAAGLDTAFLVDEIYHRDAWMLLATAAARTHRIRLAAGVAHVTLRDPLLVAQLLATLDELSGGRAAGAFSVGNLAMLTQFGRDPGELHVAPRVREAHEAMRAFLDDGRVDFDGRFFSYRGVFSTARPVRPHVPLLIGAMGGPLTFRLAGELADGVYAACSFSAEALRYIVDNVRHGAEKASRDWRSLELCASVTSAISEDGESARIAARTKAAFYLPSMPRPLIERHGVPFAEVQPINEAFARGDVATALRRTPPELADRFCIAGTPEEVTAKLKTHLLPSGINHIALALTDRRQPLDWAGIEVPNLPDLSEQIRLIGERILPAL